MDQFGNDLKKVLQAGLGAVATGLEKAQDAIEDLSKKGEPLYEQAKAAVVDVVDKAKQAINDQAKPQVDEFVNNLQQFSTEELGKIRTALDDLAKKAEEAVKPADAAQPEDAGTPAPETEDPKEDDAPDETKA
ncbi:MAG: hypothetical protein IJ189_10145 [Clostridia bacterium]|nr:hypothetical protein [Clostridia bacterium]